MSPRSAFASATGYDADFTVVVDRSEMGEFAHFCREVPVLGRVQTVRTADELWALRRTLPLAVMHTVQPNAVCEVDCKRETVAGFRAEKVGDIFSLYLVHGRTGEVRRVVRCEVHAAFDFESLIKFALDEFRAGLRHNDQVSGRLAQTNKEETTNG